MNITTGQALALGSVATLAGANVGNKIGGAESSKHGALLTPLAVTLPVGGLMLAGKLKGPVDAMIAPAFAGVMTATVMRAGEDLFTD